MEMCHQLSLPDLHRTSWSRLAMPTFLLATCPRIPLSSSLMCSTADTCWNTTMCSGSPPLTNQTLEVWECCHGYTILDSGAAWYRIAGKFCRPKFLQTFGKPEIFV